MLFGIFLFSSLNSSSTFKKWNIGDFHLYWIQSSEKCYHYAASFSHPPTQVNKATFDKVTKETGDLKKALGAQAQMAAGLTQERDRYRRLSEYQRMCNSSLEKQVKELQEELTVSNLSKTLELYIYYIYRGPPQAQLK